MLATKKATTIYHQETEYNILEFDPSFAGLSQGGNDSIHIIITNHKSTIYPAFTRAVIHNIAELYIYVQSTY